MSQANSLGLNGATPPIQKCPYCGKANADSVTTCLGCGFDFVAQRRQLEIDRTVELGPQTPAPQSISQGLFVFKGRIGRETFWLTWMALFACNFIVGSISRHSEVGAIAALLWTPVSLWVALAMLVKRWHDRAKSGWMVLILLIPFVGWLWSFGELGLLPGTIGPNRYGKDPLEPHDAGTEEDGYELLHRAERLEQGGRVQEALAAYEDIVRRYSHTTAGSDAQKSAESLRATIGS